VTTDDVYDVDPTLDDWLELDEATEAADDAAYDAYITDEAREEVRTRWSQVTSDGAPMPGDVAAETTDALLAGGADDGPDGLVFAVDPLSVLPFARAVAHAQMAKRSRARVDRPMVCTWRPTSVSVRARPREHRARRVTRTASSSRDGPDDPEPAGGRRPDHHHDHVDLRRAA
jgi:hypothetical protein